MGRRGGSTIIVRYVRTVSNINYLSITYVDSNQLYAFHSVPVFSNTDNINLMRVTVLRSCGITRSYDQPTGCSDVQ